MPRCLLRCPAAPAAPAAPASAPSSSPSVASSRGAWPHADTARDSGENSVPNSSVLVTQHTDSNPRDLQNYRMPTENKTPSCCMQIEIKDSNALSRKSINACSWSCIKCGRPSLIDYRALGQAPYAIVSTACGSLATLHDSTDESGLSCPVWLRFI